ncbi:hypothetical protein C8N24_6232 [Solirubrobacter pauli]|uniref:Uncharacterized protein n=1 Tax=Solirubrobacter pauli TaxID=166793 RepID=A0A660L2G7_9ACTN|nr:hypothetical protein [Solirubrobacter pauli]RKQ88191.1 hypothetical protein C8N24_6232 [Solirubrobacter pauli]
MLAALLATTLALPISATCADTDGDTIAITRDTPAGWVIETSTAGGRWERVLGPTTRTGAGCAKIAAASDGTLVLARGDQDRSQVRVRRPGGTFGLPTNVRHREGALHLAAAPGGQVAMLWNDWRGTSGDVFARVGGTTTRLARVRSFGPLGLTLAPDGTATAVWNESEPASKQVAEFRAGHWGRPVELYSGRHNGWSDSGVALAQAPNGRRRLLAWMGARRLRVSVAGEPTRTVAEPRVRHLSVEITASRRSVVEPWSVEAIRSALADDGSAAVVYETPDGLFAVTRGPDRAWSPPHVLVRGALEHRDTARVAVAAGGRTRVTWLPGDGSIVAAARDADGRWDTPAVLSPPREDAATPHLAAGHVVWTADGTLHIR